MKKIKIIFAFLLFCIVITSCNTIQKEKEEPTSQPASSARVGNMNADVVRLFF